MFTRLPGLCVLGLFAAVAVIHADDQAVSGGGDPADVVLSFNRAITARDMDAMMAHLANGGVQFNLRPSHGGLDAGPLTAELEARWRMIGPVLFSATESYSRTPEIVDVHTDGDIATVWVNVLTESVLAANGQKSEEKFSEIYLLFRSPEGWRIVGVADNRQPDDIGLGNAQSTG